MGDHTGAQLSELVGLRQRLSPEGDGLGEVGGASFEDQVHQLARITDCHIGQNRVRAVREPEIVGAIGVLCRNVVIYMSIQYRFDRTE